MDSKTIIYTAVHVVVFLTGTTALFEISANAQTSVQLNQTNTSIGQSEENSSQNQTTTINLNTDQLRHPSILIVTPSTATELTGRITIDGETIEQFGEQGTSINLSPYLSRGRQTIEVVGRYSPAQASIQVEFSATGSRVSQQTGGNGILQQALVIDVQ